VRAIETDPLARRDKPTGTLGQAPRGPSYQNLGMEGPLLFVKAWAFSLVAVWLYQRYFQRVGPRDPEFESFFRARPLLLAIDGHPADLDRVRDAIVKLLGNRGTAVATAGGWPWTIHALALEVEKREGRLLIHATRASVLRTREKPPAIADLLRAAAGASRMPLDVWLHSALHVDVTGTVQAPHGYTLRLGDESGPGARPAACQRESEQKRYPQPSDGTQPLLMQMPL
jgi:hypothetical protein